MKKWLFLLFVLILIGIGWGAFSLYNSTLQPKLTTEQKAINTVRENNLLKTIDQVDTYYGTKSYHVLTGTDQNGEKAIVWVPEAEGKVITRKQNEGVSKDSAVKGLYETLESLYDNDERDPKEIRSIKLGVEESIPIWEIIYIDNTDRLTYYRSYFETGHYWKFIKP